MWEVYHFANQFLQGTLQILHPRRILYISDAFIIHGSFSSAVRLEPGPSDLEPKALPIGLPRLYIFPDLSL